MTAQLALNTTDPLKGASATYTLHRSEWQSDFDDIETAINGMLAERCSPDVFGAVGDGVTDDAVALQAWVDFVFASFNSNVNAYAYTGDGAGKVYVTGTSLNLTGHTSAGAIFRNFNIIGKCTGKAVLDLTGTNAITLQNVTIYGHATSTPAIGILHARKVGGGICPEERLVNVNMYGYFSKACYVNYGSEVSQHIGCRWTNASRSTSAYVRVMTGHSDTLTNFLGGVTSEYQTLATGAVSMILHDLTQCVDKRRADVNMTILGISKANPAVVTVSSASLTASGLVNGDPVFISDITVGMVEIAQAVANVGNINLVAGTFELTGVDSSAYSTWTAGGHVYNQTGPAWLLSYIGDIRTRAGYLLSYGNTGIAIDAEGGKPVKNTDFDLQIENNNPSAVKIWLDPTAAATFQKFGVQLHTTEFTSSIIANAFRTSGTTGYAVFPDFSLSITSMGTAPTNLIFDNPSRVLLRGFYIRTPLKASMNDVTSFKSTATGRLIVGDVSPYVYDYGVQINSGTVNGNFSIGDGTTTAAEAVYINAPAGYARSLTFRSGTSNRWNFLASGETESGANVGSNWQIQAFDDAGAFLFAPLAISRKTGVVTLSADNMVLSGTKTPATAGAAGVTGTICWDSGFLYICTATNTWKRVAIATW